MTITHLVTHSGGFHADEVLSSVVLTRLHPGANLVRTRDADWLRPAAGRIIYDVGRAYDADARIFDHHQKPGPLRPDGQPYSSFGLIWHHFGAAYLRALDVPDADVAAVQKGIDTDFVLPIDLLDNGAMEPGVAGPLSKLTLPTLLESLKPGFDTRDPGATDAAFHVALGIARAMLEAAIANKAAKRRAEGIVRKAIADAGDARVLELPMGMPFRSAIEAAGADHLLFVVHPREGGDWALNTIRTGDDTFETRADLPQPWAGLTDADLASACGVPGARFCHAARFLAIADTREAVLDMAERAVQAALENPA